MKLLSAFAILITVACTRKAAPSIINRNAAPPQKAKSIYPPEETVAPDTLAGKQIFAGRCGRCHSLPETNQFTVVKWDDILPDMFPRARLNNEEALHVRTWLLANAKK